MRVCVILRVCMCVRGAAEERAGGWEGQAEQFFRTTTGIRRDADKKHKEHYQKMRRQIDLRACQCVRL